MTTLRNDELQSAIVAYLKTITAITNLLVTIDIPVGATEIREDQWQGTEFDYPNIRVRMVSNSPAGWNDQCCQTNFTVSIMAFSQDYSSWEADKIAGIISTSLNGKSFTQNNVYMALRTTSLIPAVRSDMHTWRAECLLQGTACYQSVAVIPPAPVIPWYLSGGITGSNCLIANQSIGASSYLFSKSNLANFGVLDLLDGSIYPSWNSTNGWIYDGTIGMSLLTPVMPIDENMTLIVRYSGLVLPGAFAHYLISHDELANTFGIKIVQINGITGVIDNVSNKTSSSPVSGVIALNKNGIFLNGILVVAVGVPSSFSINGSFGIGNDNGSFYHTEVNILALAIYNTPILNSQILAVSNAMAAL